MVVSLYHPNDNSADQHEDDTTAPAVVDRDGDRTTACATEAEMTTTNMMTSTHPVMKKQKKKNEEDVVEEAKDMPEPSSVRLLPFGGVDEHDPQTVIEEMGRPVDCQQQEPVSSSSLLLPMNSWQIDAKWEKTVLDIVQRPDRESSTSFRHLNVLQSGMTRFVAAHDQMLSSMTSTADLGQLAVLTVLQDILTPMANQSVSVMQELEGKLVHVYDSNHQRRLALHKQLQQFSDQYRLHCTRLMATLHSGEEGVTTVPGFQGEGEAPLTAADEEDEDRSGEGSLGHGSQGVLAADDDHHNSNGNGNEEAGNSAEPDWQALLQEEGYRTHVELFLTNRNRLKAALVRFGDGLDEFHTTAMAMNHEVTQVVAAQCTVLGESILARQYECQESLFGNFQRRCYLEEEIAKAAQVQQGLFAQLMEQISNCGAFMFTRGTTK